MTAMTDIEPEKRPTAEQALEMFEDIWLKRSAVERVLTNAYFAVTESFKLLVP